MHNRRTNYLRNIKLLFLISVPLITSVIFLIYSYFWIDHALVTFLSANKPFIGNFFALIEFTGNNKILMAKIYFVLIILMFVWQLIFLIPSIYKSLSLRPLLIILGLITLIYSLSYPFLSKDIFYYYISAKMAYFYHMNPFTTQPIALAGRDFFVTISHNIDSPYLYGPLFLIYTIIPMVILTAQKVILYFLTIKILNGILFFIAGLLLFKLTKYDRRIFAIWFLNPLLLIEWLSNSHNDVVMIAFSILAFYYLTTRKYFKSILLLIFSILIKFVTIASFPLYILGDKWRVYYMKLVGIILPMALYLTGRTIQPWYLTWSYMFLPLAKLKTVSWIILSLIGFISLANYYRFLESSSWGAGLIIPQPLVITNLLLLTVLFIEHLTVFKKILSYFISKLKTA